EEFAEPNWAQWVKLNLEMIKSDGSLLKMEMLRSEDWVFENIDYQVPDQEPANASATLTPVSTFLMSLPVEPIRIPLRPLFAQLQDVRQLLHELEVDSVVVTLHLDLPEIGVRGQATVTGVEPCPVILPGPGKVVLTTFHHASSHLIDLYVSSQPPTGQASSSESNSNATMFGTVSPQTSAEALLFPTASRSEVIDQAWERIGVTGNHPLWSADRHDYVAAMDLRIGERLKNLSGDVVWVQQKLARPGPAPVYNLEVQDEHVYYVGVNGVLAHNVGPKNNCEVSGKNPPINRPRQELHTNGTVGKSQFLQGLDADNLVQDAWLNGTPQFNQNRDLIGKIKEYTNAIGALGEKSIDVRFSRKKGIHGFPSRKRP
ncbi:MAG: polymorphic toxin-type HINT domain-containing protein, partial [Pirellulaceae bacterium]|nr:polymorphic toxin-type HINT domain-containing protein [Pirellulaceae bacterium]